MRMNKFRGKEGLTQVDDDDENKLQNTYLTALVLLWKKNESYSSYVYFSNGLSIGINIPHVVNGNKHKIYRLEKKTRYP